YRASMDGALDYDLALRVCPHARRIAHVSEVLYHRGASAAGYPDSANPAAAAALSEASERAGFPALVARGATPGLWRSRVTIAGAPRVAIVIPTDGPGPGPCSPALLAARVPSRVQ